MYELSPDRLRHADHTALTFTHLRLTAPLRLDAGLDDLRLLVAATSHAIRLTWTLDTPPRLPPDRLSHLLPPADRSGRAM